jgi:hypothetical protein
MVLGDGVGRKVGLGDGDSDGGCVGEVEGRFDISKGIVEGSADGVELGALGPGEGSFEGEFVVGGGEGLIEGE